MADNKESIVSKVEKKIVEEAKKVEEELVSIIQEVDAFTIEEFCSLKNLSTYYYHSLKMTFGNIEKKTAEEWKKMLVEMKLIKEEQIK